MTGFDIFCGTLAALVALLILFGGLWSFYYGLVNKEESELNAIFFLLGFVSLPLSALFGFWAHGDSWRFAFVILLAIGALLYVRSLLASSKSK